MRLPSLLAAAIFLGSGPLAWGQTPVPSAPTTVQLPSFSFFTVQTTVSVPDRGGMSLGGITRGADGHVQMGPLGNRAGGSSRGAGGVSATATIIDNRELDAAVLAAAAGGKPAAIAAAKAAELSRSIDAQREPSAARQRRCDQAQNAAAAEAKQAEMAALLVKAQEAEAAGKASLAKAYYGMVARQATGELKQKAEADSRR